MLDADAPSTRRLDRIPNIPDLMRLTRAAAMLDAILCPTWDLRYFSFNARWAAGEQMASMQNGMGDDWFLLFTDYGAILKGFLHESVMAADAPWPGVLSEVPATFASFLTQPAFSPDDATFCFWREVQDDRWRRGNVTFPDREDADGSADLLFILDGRPETYRDWAEEYFEVTVDLATVEYVYSGKPLTEEIVTRLNPELSLEDVRADAEEIGYPFAIISAQPPGEAMIAPHQTQIR